MSGIRWPLLARGIRLLGLGLSSFQQSWSNGITVQQSWSSGILAYLPVPPSWFLPPTAQNQLYYHPGARFLDPGRSWQLRIQPCLATSPGSTPGSTRSTPGNHGFNPGSPRSMPGSRPGAQGPHVPCTQDPVYTAWRKFAGPLAHGVFRSCTPSLRRCF